MRSNVTPEYDRERAEALRRQTMGMDEARGTHADVVAYHRRPVPQMYSITDADRRALLALAEQRGVERGRMELLEAYAHALGELRGTVQLIIGMAEVVEEEPVPESTELPV